MPPSNAPSAHPDPLSALLREAENHAYAAARRPKVANAPLARPEAPPAKALVLVTTVYTCECGACYRSPNPHVLVRYDSHENSVHYSRATLKLVTATGREHKLIARTVPYCEACFGLEPLR